FDWDVDITFVVRLRQKLSDSVATNLAIIASKFVHIHTDEFSSQLRVHVARIGKRMPHRVIPVRQPVVDAFANYFAQISTDRRRNILAHDISTKGQWQPGLLLPPLAKVDDFLKSRFLVGELSLVNDQPNVCLPCAHRVENLIEWHNDVIELPKKKLQREKCAGHRAGHSDFLPCQEFARGGVS